MISVLWKCREAALGPAQPDLIQRGDLTRLVRIPIVIHVADSLGAPWEPLGGFMDSWSLLGFLGSLRGFLGRHPRASKGVLGLGPFLRLCVGVGLVLAVGGVRLLVGLAPPGT